MARTLPFDSLQAPPRAANPAVHHYEITLVTPMFGGGTTPGENDEVTPIRSSSVRGHLRFWWRATRGAGFADVDTLHHEEARVWGATETRSPVEVAVKVTGRGSPFAASNGEKYVLFPFQGAGIVNLSFRLTLQYDTGLAGDVETALRAWVNFGGIGGRTRRGCGALFCKDLALRTEAEARGAFTWSDSQRLWPTLGDLFVSSKPPRAPVDAWQDVIGRMKEFRQGVIGRRYSGETPHRSRWPEADTLRRLSGEAEEGHQASETGLSNAFPRAGFGLPIQFRFHRDDWDDMKNNCELVPYDPQTRQVFKRMASPLVLRPLAVGSGRAVPMVLLLNVPGVPGARIETRRPKHNEPGSSPRLSGHTIPSSEIYSIAAAAFPGSPLGGTPSAVEAFLNFARKTL